MRIVVFRENDEEVGRITWDGQTMTIVAPPALKADLEDGIQDGDLELLPEDGDDFLDAVLQEFADGYLQAEEMEPPPAGP